MPTVNFPSTGLSANVTTYSVGDRTWLWTGTFWKNTTPNLGYTGSIGTGYSGSVGYTGSASTISGYWGSVGYTGSIGTGYWGSVGYTGSIGTGYWGSVGYTGSIGTGYTGSASTVQGPIGYTGSSTGGGGGNGYTGSVGYTGSAIVGYTGSSGSGGGGGASVTISTSAPGSPTAGQFWYKSDEGKLYIYYDDGDSSQWVGITATIAGSAGVGTSGGVDSFVSSFLLGL